MANEPLREKIIGSFYVTDNNRFFAADIYEGNFYKLVRGNSVETLSLTKEAYDRVVANYERCVEEGKMITTAHSLNQKANLPFSVPVQTADPEAAEKEWYLRTHPQVVPIAEPVVEEKRGFFGRKKKKKPAVIGIKCPKCGTVNKDGQKFCGECGCKLPSAEEEAAVPKAPVPEKQKQAAKPEAPKKDKPDMVSRDSKISGAGTAENSEEPKQPRHETVEYEEILDEEDVIDLEGADGQDTAIPKERRERAHDVAGAEATAPSQAVKPSLPEKQEKKEKKGRKEKRSEKRKESGKGNEGNLPEKKSEKGSGMKILIIFLVVVLIVVGALTAGYFLMTQNGRPIYGSTGGQQGATDQASSGHVVVKIVNDVAANDQITEDDLEGVILNDEQYAKYNQVSTYIDSKGETQAETLLLWENKDSVIGQYATRDLAKGSLLYDTSITKEHVIADKTYVDVDVDGETKTYETNTDVMPGSTKIQIVAIIQTDGADPQQVLLSEMTLQDRSLQSIFDSAGQDVLEKLSGGNSDDNQENGDSGEADTPAEDGGDAAAE